MNEDCVEPLASARQASASTHSLFFIHYFCRLLHSRMDARITATAAVVIAQDLGDLRIRRVWILGQERRRRHDLAAHTPSTLGNL